MDNIGPAKSTELLSQQVVDARYFFLELNPAGAAPLTLAFGGRERCKPDYRISRRHYGYYVLEYVVAGQGWVTLNRKRCALRPGSVFTYSPEMSWDMGAVASHPMEKYFFCFAGKDARARLRRANLAPGLVRTAFAQSEIQTVAEDLIVEGQRASRNTAEICATLFTLLLLKLADATRGVAEVGEPARQNFLRCKALIDAEVAELRTLDEIANRVGLEKSSVCRLFRRFWGTSPHQYLQRQKMNLAAESLLQHGGPVKELAAQLGFADPFHFSRAFKAVHGIAPSRLRSSYGA